MKNLVILNRGHITAESKTYPDLELWKCDFDSVSDSITMVLGSNDAGVLEVQQFMKTGQVILLCTFPIHETELLSFNHFVDSSELIFVFSNGDIVSATYDLQQPDPEMAVVQIAGTIEGGISSSCFSPDEEILSLLTKKGSVVLLSRLLEPISEKHLNPQDIKISVDKHVSVGWGKMETQFKGKGAKAMERQREALKYAGLDLKEDTIMRDPTVKEMERGTLSPFDNAQTKISWRGDCAYFAVTTIEPVMIENSNDTYERRVIRVFDREGELDSVSEACDGVEHNLSWKPQGSVIASTQRHYDEDVEQVLDVVFFERNGLRRGQFNTRLDSKDSVVQDLQWSSDSEILAVKLRHSVQLWTTKNYHWYLKQEIVIPEETDNEITFVNFHPEKPSKFMLGTKKGHIQVIDLAFKINTGPTYTGLDIGMVVVTDGNNAKLTPLSIANVPPPLSLREFQLESNIVDIAIGQSNEVYACATITNEIHLAYLSIESLKKGGTPKVQDKKGLVLEQDDFIKQLAFVKNKLLALVEGRYGTRLAVFGVEHSFALSFESWIDLPSKAVLLKSLANFSVVVIEMIDGSIFKIGSDLTLMHISKFPQLCHDIELANIMPSDSEYPDYDLDTAVAFGISSGGKLFANDSHICSGVTSLKVTESHLLFTTVQSQLFFMHLSSTLRNYQLFHCHISQQNIEDERVRLIERGSFLVTAMPSKYAVVLEAQRGNLETIYPRIMVLSLTRYLTKNCDYLQAFLACRTHRISLDILHDYDPESFFSNLESFICQLEATEHLDLFISCLTEEDVTVTKYRDTLNETAESLNDLNLNSLTPNNQRNVSLLKKKSHEKGSKVNKICDAMLHVFLKEKFFKKHMQNVLTAYACKNPPDLKSALSLIGTFDNEEQASDAVTHLCFLQDVNKLYDTALGLYDVKLTLVIAQNSQKDPKEYLPFLQHLYVQPELKRNFLIDDYLKKYNSALNWLHQMGGEAYDEFDEYLVNHDLYREALSIYRYDAKRNNNTLYLYAQHLTQVQHYAEAGLTYEYLGDKEKALENFISSKKWREALSLAQETNDEKRIRDVALLLVNSLKEERSYAAAAEIECSFLGDVEEAIKLFCQSYLYHQALLLASRDISEGSVYTIIDESLMEGFSTIAEFLSDCKGQLNSQLRRLKELREKKEESPLLFYGSAAEDADAVDDVSVAPTETSTAPSFFTRYTGKTKGTAKTGASRKTSKNRKREERKRAKGRKGTIYEEEYLINSVGRLVERLSQTQPDAIKLIEGLLRRSFRQQAYQIQKTWLGLTDILSENIVEIYSMSEKDRERVDENGEIYMLPEFSPPKIPVFEKFNTLDF